MIENNNTQVNFRRRIADWLFGYDYFISYAHADGHAYTKELTKRLVSQGFECFVDQSEFAAGDNWRREANRALRNTTRLIVIASPAAHQSPAVSDEVRMFLPAR